MLETHWKLKSTDAGNFKIMIVDIVLRLSQEFPKDLTQDELQNIQYGINEICTKIEALRFDVTYKMEVDNREFKGEY